MNPTPPQARVCVNLACGDTFVAGWHNLDYAARPEVTRANLLGRLPFADGSVDVLYSSHFLEHVPTDRVPGLLAECRRILKPGGALRLCLPDLELLCRAYLRHLDAGEEEKAAFVLLATLDQCVRMYPGGGLGRFYRDLPSKDPEIVDFVKHFTNPPDRTAVPAAMKKRRLLILKTRLENLYCRAVVRLLPRAFREQNVSMARVGERHMWMYDFATLRRILEESGFAGVVRHRHDTSDIAEFPLLPLDMNADGRPRMGEISLYAEARKATVDPRSP